MLEGAAGAWCFCLGCCEKQLKQNRRGWLELQREEVEASGDNDKLDSCYGAFHWKDFTDCSNNLCIAVTIAHKSCAFLLSVMKFKCHFLLAVVGDCLPNFSSVIFFPPWPRRGLKNTSCF